MNKGYLIYQEGLPDGIYKVPSKENWHIRLRIRLAYWLLMSVKKTETATIKTETGTNAKTIRGL